VNEIRLRKFPASAGGLVGSRWRGVYRLSVGRGISRRSNQKCCSPADCLRGNRLPDLDAFCISGELALSGQVRPVKGVLSIALKAKRRGRQAFIVPLENAAEAAVVEGVDVYGAGSLSEVVQFLREEISLERCVPSMIGPS
jgi:hypothetical protein